MTNSGKETGWFGGGSRSDYMAPYCKAGRGQKGEATFYDVGQPKPGFPTSETNIHSDGGFAPPPLPREMIGAAAEKKALDQMRAQYFEELRNAPSEDDLTDVANAKFRPGPVVGLMTALGLSQNQLAEAIGTTSASMSRWLNGERIPSSDFLIRLMRLARKRGIEFDPIEDDGSHGARAAPRS